MKFQVEFTTRAEKELKSLPVDVQQKILQEALCLETTPFPFKKKRKRIQGMNFPCFRLRIDAGKNSFRLFYGIERNIVYVLKIVSKKDADKIIKSLRKIDFPPDTSR
ncbi:MAG: type II toxin-antitoxin system RelE/ParE family toxin [bacterium]